MQNQFRQTNRFCTCCFRFRTKVALQQHLFIGDFFGINFKVVVLVLLSCPQSMRASLQLRKLLLIREPYPSDRRSRKQSLEKNPYLLLNQDYYPWDVNQPPQNLHFNPLENLDTKVTRFTVKVIMQHELETQQVLICYADPDPPDFLYQVWSNLGTSDTQTVLLLKSIGKW